MRALLVVLALASPLLFSSCGRPYTGGLKDGFTRILLGGGESANLRPFTAPISASGQAMLFATRTDNQFSTARRFVSGAGAFPASGPSSVFWDVPNGSYKFAMVGYDHAGMGVPNSDNPICADGQPSGGAAGDTVTLSGGTQTITFTGGGCPTGSTFRESQAYTSISFQLCAMTEDLTLSHSAAAPCGGGNGISTTPAGAPKSMLIFMSEGGGPPGAGPQMKSGCITLGGTANSTQNLKYPGGNNSKATKLQTEIAFYSSTDCGNSDGGTSLLAGFDFPLGFASAGGIATSPVDCFFPNNSKAANGGLNALWVDDASTARLWLRKFF